MKVEHEHEIVTCEIHDGALCFRGGNFGSLWTCPACELERLQTRVMLLQQRLVESPKSS